MKISNLCGPDLFPLAQTIRAAKEVTMSDDKAAAQQAEAKKAMELKAKAEAPHHPEAGDSADEGMIPTPNTGIAPSGALNAEGQRPVLERSHKVR